MKARHTEGPWRLRLNDSGMCNGVAVSATVLPPEPFTGPYIAEVGSSLVNARLIAAAPEMYEALRELLAMYDAHTRTLIGLSVAVKLAKADAAIAQAEGR